MLMMRMEIESALLHQKGIKYDKQGNMIQESGGKVDWTYSYNSFGQQIRKER